MSVSTSSIYCAAHRLRRATVVGTLAISGLATFGAAGGALSMPIAPLAAAPPAGIEQVRLVCTPAGRCYRAYPRYRVVHRYRPARVTVIYGQPPVPIYVPGYGRRFAPVYTNGHPFAYGPGYYAAEVYDGCGPYTCGTPYSVTYSAAYGYAPTQWTGTMVGVGLGF